ncbi:dTDP-4-dehydrorhamnose reductase [Paenibacillus glycinis]|uniref:dTDP-4-dehydrorhamnose reductase n=1 Tax=Paenibacillus glycinis TaxID=2697035 RepID=A0ABW9XYG9_9BACL|nr:dTDP-4-dehydrorhamnose reductase [Paenibacillus glycinis]NBD27561.1 dTDP-4-dehydrorhamnose reductase [Paenibacillus glycinis]
MRIIVTGANGQLGQELLALPGLQQEGISMLGFGRGGLDVTNLQNCREVVKRYQADAVIHCAAYTAVDQAESEPAEAFRINAEGTRNIALAAREFGAKLVYVSTDYVFEGTASEPYEESGETKPRTVYGKSKLAGEQEATAIGGRTFIVRTSWVYGKHGRNFVETIRELAKTRDEIRVVMDQLGSPTYTLDLAEFLIRLVRTEHYGIYHATGTGVCSWYQFAQAILEESGAAGVKLLPCTTADFPRPAPRPAYSVLRHGAIGRQGMQGLRHWRAALAAYMRG